MCPPAAPLILRGSAALLTSRARFATTPTPPYGAPFTDSISFGQREGRSDEFTLTLRVPDLPHATLTLHAPDTLSDICAQVAAATGASRVQLLRNGLPVAAFPSAVGDGAASAVLIPAGGPVPSTQAMPAALPALFDGAVDVAFDGVRYSVNEGARLSGNAWGRVVRRSLFRSYAYATVGGIVCVAAAFAFWGAVIPDEHNRLKHG